MNTEAYQFLTFVNETFVSDVRGDDYTKWSEEYGAYLYDCLMEVKPDMARAVTNTILDPRVNFNEDTFISYLYRFWNHEFIFEGE